MTSDPRASGATRRTALAGGLGLAATALVARAQSASEIIDIHAHIRSDDRTRYPPLQSVAGRPDRGQTVEQLLAEMDAAGVAKAAVVQLASFYGADDSYLADSMAKAPRRLTGVCSVDVLTPDAARTLQGWLKRGITGLRIFTGGTGGDDTALLDDPRTFPVWALAEEHRIPVCAQTQSDGLAKVRNIARRFPKAIIILDHGSHPNLEDGPPYAAAQSLFDMASLPNVYVKVTPPLFALTRKGGSTPDAFFQALNKAFGANRIAFGSNLPMTAGPLTKIVADARACLASLSPADQAMIFAGTAKRLYPALA
jgi:predicted TIM-barrel fold metal-dependent hydrolase